MMGQLKIFLETIKESEEDALVMLGRNAVLAKQSWEKADDLIKGSTALHWAAHEGHMALVKRLVEFGADMNAAKADWWCRPIDWAADSAQADVVGYLLGVGVDISGDKWSNCTPLHVVAQGGSTNGRERSKEYGKVTELLIAAGAEINSIAKYGGAPPPLTPLDDAEQVDNLIVIKILLDHQAKRAVDLI